MSTDFISEKLRDGSGLDWGHLHKVYGIEDLQSLRTQRWREVVEAACTGSHPVTHTSWYSSMRARVQYVLQSPEW